jgi:O-antigen ligase
VTTSIPGVGAVGPSNPRALAVALAGLVGVIVAATVATRFDMLPIVLGIVAAALLTVASFRWPLLPLAVFVALIPIEEVVILDGVGTLSRLAGLLFAVTYAVPRLGRITLSAMPVAAWAYLGWAILSLGWAIKPATAWNELPTLIQLFVVALLVADFVVHRPEVVRPILWVYSLSAAVTAILGIASYLALGSATARAAALQGQNPAQFAAILLPALVFAFYEIMYGERRLLAAGIALVTAIGVVISGTRAAWVGVGVVVLLFILPRFSARRRILAVGALLALGAVAYQLPGIPNLVAERTDNAISTGGAGRTDIWTVALKIYSSAPATGVGFANFPVAYTADVIRAAGVTSRSGQVVGRGPHNLVVGTLVELGPIGLLLLALFLGPLILRRGWGPNAAVIQAALASLLATALFLDILSNRKQVWLVIGIAAGLAYLARRNQNIALREGAPAASPQE